MTDLRDHSPRYDELLPAYALGALDGEELRELAAHLAADCAECRRQLDLWEGDLEELAAAVPPVTPSAETRQRVLRLAGGGAATVRPMRTPAPRPWRWLALPAAALLALAVWSGWREMRAAGEIERLRADRARLAQQVATLDRELAAARGDAERMARTLAIITAPGARAVQLAGLGSTPRAVGHTFVDPRAGKAVFYGFGLPPLPAG